MPGEIASRITRAYEEWTSIDRHPARIVLATCSRGYTISTYEEVMGAKDRRSPDIVVKSMVRSALPVTYPLTNGTCLAITAKYDGLETLCYSYTNSLFGSCIGTTEDVLVFKRVGAVTELSTTQYRQLQSYARAAEYQPSQ